LNHPTREHRNRLAGQHSPYLLQHAGNPVDWYPWGEEAFEKAKQEDKPIFLSIGYSTCHWCHVMERESFEDPEVARQMNDTFVCIKLDREERPEIDAVYMTVCQMLTGGGGWPLTIIMTPEKKPFFAGTYFPRDSRFGRPGMLQLTARIAEVWKGEREAVRRDAAKIAQALAQTAADQPGDALDEQTLQAAFERLVERFDNQQGGFGSAPKFPTPHHLLFLLRYWKRTGSTAALEMVEKTLEAMRRGGIFDPIGFGFHRYSTDSRWLVPHFEKMLYDQALSAMAYVEAFQATGKPEYAQTAREIFTYVLRELTSPEGGFYSAEDADSEGEEGRFYLWTAAEIRKVLDNEEADLVIRAFGVEEAGNFDQEATGKRTGANILHQSKSLLQLSKILNLPEAALTERLEAARGRLFEARDRRVHPLTDDKILTDWNGLMIAALAKGAQALGERRYREAAERAATFILNQMRTPEGRLLHRYRDGQAGLAALVDDYAFLIWGLLELYEATFDAGHLRVALELNQDLLRYYWDEKAGAFYFTAKDAEELLVRRKEAYDGAVPSGNSVAALNLLRLGRITGEADLERQASRIGQVFSESVRQAPSAFTQLLLAVDFAVGPSYEVVIVGEPASEDTRGMLAALRGFYSPNKVVLLRPAGEASPAIGEIAPFTQPQTSLDGKATAYVCSGYSCAQPTTDAGKMLELLEGATD